MLWISSWLFICFHDDISGVIFVKLSKDEISTIVRYNPVKAANKWFEMQEKLMYALAEIEALKLKLKELRDKAVDEAPPSP